MPDSTRPFNGDRRHHSALPWLVAGALWTILLGAVMVFALTNQYDQIAGLARVEAETAFQKDLAYRIWAAGHGGVYVPPTEDTPPNPYLAGTPDRDVTTVGGKRLTLVNPAYMTRQVHDLGRARYGARGHLTSLDPIRPENGPDPWEEEALRSFDAGATEAVVVAPMDGEPHFRFMRPFVTEPACMGCHAAQGYQVGQIRGGISVSVPLAPYVERHAELRSGLQWRTFGVWVLGIAGILFLRRTVTGHRGELASREEWFWKLVEQSGEGLFLADRDGNVVDVNERACRMLGYSREELLGLTMGDIDPRFLAPGEMGAVWERFSAAGAKLVECQYRRKDGTTLPVEVLASVAVADGEQRFLGLVRDVTEREGRESVLAARLRLLEASHDHPMDDLLRISLDAAEELTGSEVGFFHFLEEDQQTLSLQIWSTNTAAQMCSEEGKVGHSPVDQAGAWADAVRQRGPVIHNDFREPSPSNGLPKGHVPMERVLAVPVFRGEKIVAVLGVGNKPTGYTDGDATTASALADLVWDILGRRRAEESLAWERRVSRELAGVGEAVADPDLGIEAVAEKVLACARELTGSEHGYVSEIDPVTGANVGHTLTAMLGKVCQISDPEQKISFPRSADGTYSKLWGHALNTGEPFFTNAPQTHPAFSGIPWGHVSLRQFLSVPVMDGGRPIGQIALANSTSPYTEQHLAGICRLAELYGAAILRRRPGADGSA